MKLAGLYVVLNVSTKDIFRWHGGFTYRETKCTGQYTTLCLVGRKVLHLGAQRKL